MAVVICENGDVDNAVLSDVLTERVDQMRSILGGEIGAVPLPDRRYLLFNDTAKHSPHQINQTATEMAQDAESIGKSDYIAGIALIIPQSVLV